MYSMYSVFSKSFFIHSQETTMTRGIRNNNPLNIRHSADQWQGMRAQQTDQSFVQFESMDYGYRAAWKVLESYWNHFEQVGKLFNARNILTRWAPPTENDTEAYFRTVLRLSGVGGNETFPKPSRGTGYGRLEVLLRAMTTVECGIPYDKVDVGTIRQGFHLAFPGVLKKKRKELQPKVPVDVNVSKLPSQQGTTFAAWDEYWDW